MALVAEEMLEYQIKLAGGEVKRPRRALRGKKEEDPYGDQLALRKRIKGAAKTFTEEDIKSCLKPL